MTAALVLSLVETRHLTSEKLARLSALLEEADEAGGEEESRGDD